jgi:hypothetical protein
MRAMPNAGPAPKPRAARIDALIVVTTRDNRRTVLTHMPIVLFGPLRVEEERRRAD